MPKKAGINTEEATLRMALKESDFKALLDELEEAHWDHPVFWRLRTKWSEHLRGKGAVQPQPRRRKAAAVAS